MIVAERESDALRNWSGGQQRENKKYRTKAHGEEVYQEAESLGAHGVATHPWAVAGSIALGHRSRAGIARVGKMRQIDLADAQQRNEFYDSIVALIKPPTGEVVGIERDPRTIRRARARVLESGLANVTFTQSDVNDIATAKPFDAVVGRYILMYLPDPTAVLQALTQLVRPGGVVAFLDVSWAPLVSLAAGLPLWSVCISLIVELFLRSGVNPEMGLALHQVFPAAGLPVPKMQMEVLLGGDIEFARGLQDLLLSLRPKFEQCQLDIQPLGDFDTLALRLHAELAASHRVASWLAIVSAWSRKLAS
jgi:SAM-dependent methyltransferase